MAKKVLIVTYYWPPAGGPGVQRWLKFVKYLPEFGIEPIVFIPENASYPLVDASLEEEITKDITIIKFPIKEPYGIASTLSRKQTKNIASGILPKEEKQSLLQKAMLYIRGNFFIPDARIGWVKPSIRFLESYIVKNKINTLITTGPPHSLHLIGKDLKIKYPKLQWIADFRDPWTTIGYHEKLRMTSRTKEIHKALEREVLESADKIIVTSPGTKEEYQAITAKPIHLITNGFDMDIMPKIVPEVDGDTFVIGHFGSLLSDRNPTVLWEAMSELCEEYSAFAKALSLRFAGKISEDVLESIAKHKLNDNIDILGYVTHSELINEYDKVSLLLLIEINSTITRAIIPGKLFEYLAARKPILAIGPKDSDIENILIETNAGSFYHYDQKVKIKKAILERFENRRIPYNSKEEVISKYHRKQLTAKLATLLKSDS